MTIIFSQRLWYIMLEQFLMKYVWSGTGMVMVSIPIIFGNKGRAKFKRLVQNPVHLILSDLFYLADSSSKDGGVSERTQYFTTAKNMLVSGADAVERLMTSYKV